MTISNNVQEDKQAHVGYPVKAKDLSGTATSMRYIPLSDRYFEHVGAPLPSHVDWQSVMKVEAYRPDGGKALVQLVSTVLLMTLCWTLLTMLPWYLLPLAWAFAGVAATGLFVISRDCAFSAWSPNRIVNDVIGTISCAPLLTYLPTSYVAAFFASTSSESNRSESRVTLNTSVTVGASVLFLAGMVYFTGITGLIKYWLLPFVAFHIWLRFYANLNMVVPESAAADGTAANSIFAYFKLPSWLEFMSNGLNVCASNGVALARIPSYHMRSLRAEMEQRLAPYMNICVVNWRLLLKLMGRSKTAFVTVTQRAFVSDSTATSAPATAAASHPSLFTVRGMKFFLTKRVNWIHVTLLFGTPAIAIYGAFFDHNWSFQTKTFWWAVAYYFFTGLGITAGYHRLWSHQAYKASSLMEWILSFAASGAVEGSAIWWCRNHRAHHRYTDTHKDPYSASRGFWYAHIGWMLVHPEGENYGKANVKDLKAIPALAFQHKTYPLQVLFWGFVFPTVVAGLGWGDWRGGYYMAAVMRLIFVHHSTFCVNSVAHYFGSHTYDDARTPRDHLITAFMTLGEGYHNFHHEFPNDYRNGIRAFDYDPTKWLIATLNFFGLAYDLKTFPHNEVQKGKLNMKQKKLDALKSKLKWPTPLSTLPVWTMDEVERRAKAGEALVVIDGVVHDVANFVAEHPGGEALIRSGIGKDASADFNGDVYKHSNAARNLMSNFRVATIQTKKDA